MGDRQRSGIWRSLRDGDFEEEEVWAVVMKERPENNNNKANKEKGYSSPLPFPRNRTLPSAARMIPTRDHSSSSNNSSSASSSHEAKLPRQSVPVNIPDWSKIYMTNNNKNVSEFGDFDLCRSFDDVGNDCDDDDDGDDEGGGEEENDECDPRLPPHEFIARRLARSQISSFSVFEGAGRTLKGRDLSKVRNAVLTKTGFLESL